jgi:hypothetical protein
MGWPDTWFPIEFASDKQALVAELLREVQPGHPLHGLQITAIGRRYGRDDVLFLLQDGSDRVAEVHLTWVGERERPPWPHTLLFPSFKAWLATAQASAEE